MSTTQWSDPQNDYKLFLFRQQIDGSLAPPQRFTPEGSGGYDGMGVATGDIDGDGLTDVVLATVAGVNVFLQRGGSLAAPVLIQQTAGASDVEVADLNGDGRNDVVIRGAGIEVARNTGLGFSVTAVTTESATEVEVGDVTGDALVDLVAGGYHVLRVYPQLGDGTFGPPISHAVGTGVNALEVADVTSDGRQDVAVVGDDGPRGRGARPDGNNPSYLEVLPQTASGGFGPQVALFAPALVDGIEALDMSGDGRADLVTLHGIWGQAAIYLQNSRGTLQSSDSHLSMYEFSTNPKGIAAGDINSDGLPDIVVAGTRQHGLFVLRQVPHALPPVPPAPPPPVPPPPQPPPPPPGPPPPIQFEPYVQYDASYGGGYLALVT